MSNSKLLMFVVMLITGWTQSSAAGEQLSLIDIPVRKVYIPNPGFDDNDTVEVVVEGTLPSPCFSLGKTVVGPVVNNTFTVRQLAWKHPFALCESPFPLDEPVPFTSVASLGMLPMGNYTAVYSKPDSTAQKRFGVVRADSDRIDNFNYAAIESVDFDRVYYEGDEVFADLKGVWTSKCQKLQEPVTVERQEDLFIVLPILVPASEPCEKTLAPFTKKISLGRLSSGTYLVHSRSRGGKAIYRSFQVWPHLD